MQEMAAYVSLNPGLGRSPGGAMATHPSILVYRISWIEEPGGLQSMGHRVTSFASDRNNSEVWLGLSSKLPNGIKAKLPYVGFSSRAHLACLLPSLVPLPYSPTENCSKWITFISIFGGSDSKVSVYHVGDLGLIPGSGSSLEKEMATHSSALA